MTDNQSLEKQREYTSMLESIMNLRKKGARPMAYVRTYGCQGNVADGEKISGMLSQMGFEFTQDPGEADLILYNTCAIREHAQDRVFGNVGALKNIKRRNPSTLIILCGCMTQQPHVAQRIKNSYPFVNLVFGTHVLHKFPELLFKTITGGKRIFEIPQEDGEIVEGVPVRRDGEFKAWVPIMFGCDNFCSYCIVPYVRGRERSRDPEVILSEIKELAQNGYKDITLLGQNVNSYGKSLENPITFAALIERICEIPGDFLVRFMTSHPKDCTHELLDVMAKNEKCAKHLHLPFQSGSDKILAAMNRKYTREKYLSLILYAKEKMPDLCITSDIIVGFPGETYDDFKETLEVVRKAEFSSLFTFIFSPREGTPASKMDDPVSHDEKSRWFAELLKVQEEYSLKNTGRFLGKTIRVLVDGQGKNGLLTGRTEGNLIIELSGNESLIGQFVNAKVTENLTWILKGEIL